MTAAAFGDLQNAQAMRRRRRVSQASSRRISALLRSVGLVLAATAWTAGGCGAGNCLSTLAYCVDVNGIAVVNCSGTLTFRECCNPAIPGYYSLGGAVGVGVQVACPAGSYGDTSGLQTSNCSGLCRCEASLELRLPAVCQGPFPYMQRWVLLHDRLHNSNTKPVRVSLAWGGPRFAKCGPYTPTSLPALATTVSAAPLARRRVQPARTALPPTLRRPRARGSAGEGVRESS